MHSVREALRWPVDTVAAAVIDSDGAVLGSVGEQDRVFPLASVTKLLVAYATLVAVEEGAIDWAEPAGPEGSTVRHLISHASGLNFTNHDVMAKPGTRRIYSSAGFEVLAETISVAAGMPFERYLDEALCQPLGLCATALLGSAGHGARSSCADLSRFAAELQAPTLIDPSTLAQATAVQFPGLDG
ncbi:MAG: serine hydrolase domain-containing protein, partial [Sciscionella sp.]